MSNKYITIFKDNLKTNKGKKLIQFSLFLAISFTFWMAITLNENFHYDVNFPITISNIPPKVTLISETPRSIKVSLNAKGIHYLKFKFWSEPLIKIDFKTHSQNNRISLGNSELQELTRNIFGNNSQALSFAPDSINIYYTNNPGKLVKLFIDHEISTDNRHIINGEITSNFETVTLYSIGGISPSISEVKTEPIKCADLKSTTILKVKVIPPIGMRVIPDSVNITIPIEPLLQKKSNSTIEIINCPNNERLIIFPTKTELSYLLPKSSFNFEAKRIKAVVDYSDIHKNANKLPIKLIDIPSSYKDITSSIDSVEYIIEQN